ncbi:formyl transferase, C-terminal domain protein [Micavibrio aeruginosavorus ARL-13]|uniref:Formyl transferase, C-terminal domain protein n=2 Tax=Micavibrio aeruginosavorus TaxID=349221 RepID=G2KLW9_MICAA|nr:formyl transferase, C-terminal domain protein [Micavibrio aeruginosavorus ARL-13]
MRVGFVGRGTLGRDVLKGLIDNENIEIPFVINCRVTPEVGAGRDVFEKMALDNNIPFHFSNTLNADKWISYIREQNVDLVVAMLWLDTIGEEVISGARLGFLNLHGGMLPRYRGNACSNWAILNKEDQQGLSVHLMEAGKLDSGPVVLQEIIPMTDRTTIKELMDHIDKRGAELVLQAVGMIVRDEYTLTSQNEEKALRCYPRLPRDGEINWHDAAEKIERLIRAAGDPYPGAYSFYSDVRDEGRIKKMTICSAHIEEHPTEFCAVPGHVLKIQDDLKRAVVCGDMKLLVLDEIRIDGISSDPVSSFRTVRQRMGLDTEILLNELWKLKERLNA